ncbi:MAG TPA: ATP-dependent zinc protease [Pseudomonas xinjiangensis]|uniref:ATP-dependent zinc protease n=2 Tax=root TaxID=1 RepID=A0A7V1FT76_9GAMM|nr:ATP-dependent zinc protease [Halopseudomonas xinjiangensis]HEC47444.1 ATP-dependent zinc protease [Halopseudomonas xinjiangensis]
MKKIFNVQLAPALLALCFAAPYAAADAPIVFGWIEEGKLLPEKVSVKMKLDTGALTSSLHAEDLEKFERNGDDWIRFRVELEDIDTDEMVESEFEREIERHIKVRGAGGSERRPVVKMRICLGNRIYHEEFSLNDRDKMNYPLLIGRRTLEKLGVVDASKTFTSEPDCSDSESQG